MPEENVKEKNRARSLLPIIDLHETVLSQVGAERILGCHERRTIKQAEKSYSGKNQPITGVGGRQLELLDKIQKKNK